MESATSLHHRIGGLEIEGFAAGEHDALHHRIGGLEKHYKGAKTSEGLHHRIGGLESWLLVWLHG